MKSQLILLACLLGLSFFSCTSENEFEQHENYDSDLSTRGVSVTYIENTPKPMYSYKRTNFYTGKIQYIETYMSPGIFGFDGYNKGDRYSLCTTKTQEADMIVGRTFNTSNYDMKLRRGDDVLDPNEHFLEDAGYIYSRYKIGLVPLQEYYSPSNQGTRYFIYDSEIQDMQAKGEDYHYVRTLGYVCPGVYNVYDYPYTEISYESKSHSDLAIYFYQVTYGKLHHTDDMIINFNGSATRAIAMTNRLMKFELFNRVTKESRSTIEFVPINSKVHFQITESDDFIVTVR